MNHVIYKPEDKDIPSAFYDYVVNGGLAICRVCNKGEADLDDPCEPIADAAVCESKPKEK